VSAQLFNFDMEFKLGIPEMDEEHIILVNMLNEVHNFIRGGEKEKASAYFKQTLAGYVGTHFSDEESFMEKINYPQLDEHRKIHANFKQSIEATLSNFDASDEAAFRNALTDVFTWIISHIGKTDKKYATFYKVESKI
jgi:hemerythrin